MGRGFLRNHWGLVLLLLLVLPVRVSRARLESSIWIDETYSLLIIRQPLARILDFCIVDTNPPGYFLALKAWMKLARAGFGEPGILWARLLSCLGWVALAVASWLGGRKILGRATGAVLAWTVAGSAYAALFAKDARGYSLASVALFGCFLILCTGRAAPARLWALYVIAASIALWTHTLSALVLALLFVAWLAMTLLSKRPPRSLAAGAIAHGVLLILFLPWLIRLGSQVSSLRQSAPAWMTPASGRNWLSVFWYWYPFGPIGLPEAPPSRLWIVLGILSVAAPVGLFAAALAARRQPRQDGGALTVGSTGLVLAVSFVTLLWLLQRLQIAPVFHAPRYPGLTAAFWAAGLTGLAAWAVRRLGWKDFWVWAAMAPWLAAAALGQALVQEDEGHRGLATVSPAVAALLPPAGATLFVTPAELTPFHRGFLSRYRAVPIDQLPCQAAQGMSEATVVNLSFWPQLGSAHDLVAREAIEGKVLAQTVAAAVFPESEKDYTFFRITGFDLSKARELCAHGFVPAGRDIPASALAVALPEDQLYTDGWSYPEVGPSLDLRRWGAAPRVTVRFDRQLGPGDYVLHYRGYRTALPAPSVSLRFRFEATEHAVAEPEGDFAVSFRVHLDRATRPLLLVGHPTWSPAGSPGARRLSSLLWYAWIEAP